MTPDRLEAIQQRAERATKGPWTFRVVSKREAPDGSVMIGAVAPGHQIRATPPGGSYPSSDGEFIAHAREDIPWLVQQVRELTQKLEQQQDALAAWADKDRWLKAQARIAQLEAERETFYMDYRVKCDKQTKAQAVKLEQAEAALKETQARCTQAEQERDNFVQQCGDWQIAANEFEQQLRTEREAHRQEVEAEREAKDAARHTVDVLRQGLDAWADKERWIKAQAQIVSASERVEKAESHVRELTGQLEQAEAALKAEREKRERVEEELANERDYIREMRERS